MSSVLYWGDEDLCDYSDIKTGKSRILDGKRKFDRFYLALPLDRVRKLVILSFYVDWRGRG